MRLYLLPSRFFEVPKIILENIPVRTAVRDTQLAEQLVEVPTIVSLSSLQMIMEQTVDIPVPGGGGRLAGLQGFLPGQSSTALTVAQIVDNPAPGGGIQGFRPGQSSSASFSSRAGVHENADEPGEWVFRTFPRPKKSARVTRHSSARVSRQSGSSTLSSHQMARAARPQDITDEGKIFREDDEKIWVRLARVQWKLLCTDIVVDQPWP